MKKIKSLGALAVFGLLAFAAEVQSQTTETVELYLPINNVMNFALVGQVQQEAVQAAPGQGVIFHQIQATTKLKISTRSLLALIAADQGFTLPPKAKLLLSDDTFYVLNQDNTIFTNVDRELLSITYVTNILESTLMQTTNSFTSTSIKTSVAVLVYNGSSITFTLNCYGRAVFYDLFSHNNVIVVRSYSGLAFGSGTCDGQNMVVKGSLTGKETWRSNVGGQGLRPGNPNPPVTPLPAPLPPILPPIPFQPLPPGDPGTFPGGVVTVFRGGPPPILPPLPPTPIDPGTFPGGTGGVEIIAPGRPPTFIFPARPIDPGTFPSGGAVIVTPGSQGTISQ